MFKTVAIFFLICFVIYGTMSYLMRIDRSTLLDIIVYGLRFLLVGVISAGVITTIVYMF